MLFRSLGYLVHPQSPRTFAFLWLHAVEKVLNPTGQAVGAEWMPVDNQTSVTAKGYSAKKPGKYRATVTFSSYSESHEAVIVTTNEVSWSLV